MDASEVAVAMALLAIGFSLGYIYTFLYKVKLAFRKDAFVCKRCGNCCRLRLIEISPEDIKRIEDAGHKNFYDKLGGEYFLKRKNGKCFFMNSSDSCSIYKIRPRVCKEFPFFKIFGFTYCTPASYCPGFEEFKKNA